MEPFRLFGVQHIIALILVVAASALAFQAGRSRFTDLLNRLGALFFIAYGATLWWYKLADGLDWEYDLPLQLCDLIYLICLACFFVPKPLLVTLATYWGLGGTVQALLTPDVGQAFPSPEFVIFFVGHSAIIVAIFFLLGRAPHQELAGWKGLKTSFLWLLGYVALAGTFNKLLKVNYGYLSAKPEAASVLDMMGPWPVYVLAGLTFALVLFAIISGALKMLPLERARG
ncbi:MAG: TIGR02206 family membrane protein [Candidatus Eremiobacteraeota bacterium]|nr:TIGR02206 family membrane protein [Candidatus Eremiobacteraeota bacterium]